MLSPNRLRSNAWQRPSTDVISWLGGTHREYLHERRFDWDSVDVTIHRRDGGIIDVPDRCRPALHSLARALKRAGIAMTAS